MSSKSLTRGNNQMQEQKAKVLIYDIETSPIIGYTWGVWQTDVIDILEDWQVLSVAWKWLGDKKVYCIGQDDFKDYVAGMNNDIHVVEKIHELFDQADVVVAHNGNSFDQKKSQARMMVHGMQPPSPYKQIDTKLVAKRFANFTRNNLKHLVNDLQTDNRKGDPGGFRTWQGCLAGDKKSWSQMKKYNKMDITSLEDLYLRFLPWISNHPNIGRIEGRIDVCPKCGSDKLQQRGFRITNVSKFRRAQCQNCGGWCSNRVSENNKTDTKPTYTNYSN